MTASLSQPLADALNAKFSDGEDEWRLIRMDANGGVVAADLPKPYAVAILAALRSDPRTLTAFAEALRSNVMFDGPDVVCVLIGSPEEAAKYLIALLLGSPEKPA
jgi:hypothetical protein